MIYFERFIQRFRTAEEIPPHMNPVLKNFLEYPFIQHYDQHRNPIRVDGEGHDFEFVYRKKGYPNIVTLDDFSVEVGFAWTNPKGVAVCNHPHFLGRVKQYYLQYYPSSSNIEAPYIYISPTGWQSLNYNDYVNFLKKPPNF